MKSKSSWFHPFPNLLVLCLGPVLGAATASADVINFNENNGDNVWVIPPGVNVLAGATPTPATASSNSGSGASNNWSVLTDGSVGTIGGLATIVSPNTNAEVIFALDLNGHPDGRDIATFDSYCVWNDGGRDNQNYTLYYSTVSAPTVWIPVTSVSNTPPNAAGYLSTHTSLSDTSGHLAQHVHSFKIHFDGQENGWVGYSEFKAIEAPPILTTNEVNPTGVWTLPTGANLLNGNTVTTPSQPPYDHGNGTLTSSRWGTLTDGLIGGTNDLLACVSPSDRTTVTFPLDLSLNTKGYNLSSFDSYTLWADTGRANQDFSIRYSTWDHPTVFIPLTAVVNHTVHPGTNPSTHTRITAQAGYLATGVAAVQIYFNGQQNSWTTYREFILLGSAVPLSPPITWTGDSGAGENSTWITGADNNWTPGIFDPGSPLTFDQTGLNRNISLPAPVTATSLAFSNNSATPYVFSGSDLTVANDITAPGSGTATFNNNVSAPAGVTMTGSGNLIFNGNLTVPDLVLSGTGGIALNGVNPSISGIVTVNSGTLTVGNSTALQFDPLVMTGGVVKFITSGPSIVSLSGTAGQVILGNSTGPVNTELGIGDPISDTTFAGTITEASGAKGSLFKSDLSRLTLTGDNTYTGTTYVFEGCVEMGQRLSLYHGNTALWTADNLLVGSSGTLAFSVGNSGGFSIADLIGLDLGGFEPGATLGIDTTIDSTFPRIVTEDVSLLKSGTASLTLTGSGTYERITIGGGNLTLASAAGPADAGDLYMGTDGHASMFVRTASANQFGPNSVLHMVGKSFGNAGKLQLGGFSQTFAGLESPLDSQYSIIQNDETTTPGYTILPGPVTLTVNAALDHSFFGFIRDQNGGPLSLVKNGPGTQELTNVAAVSFIGTGSFGYTGPTTITAGTLRLYLRSNSSFASNVTVTSPGILELKAGGNSNFDRLISGTGGLLVTGNGFMIVRNNANSYSGGTLVDGGSLAVAGSTTAAPTSGAGTASGQFCTVGAMTPTNVVTVKNNGAINLDQNSPLGQSTMLPAFAPSLQINQGGRINGGTNALSFVPNITLDGGAIQLSSGSTTNGFNTCLALVGTLKVGGASSTPARIYNATDATGATANASLGSLGLPGTTFEVADVTGDSSADLVVSSVLRDVSTVASPLVKTGAGTMSITAVNTYTGATTVTAGVLSIANPCLADGAAVSIATGAFLDLPYTGTDTVGSLTLGGTLAAAGTYGSMANPTPGIIHTPRITGTGLILATTGSSGSDPYAAWAAVIPNPADRDASKDPDHDGFSNLQEFLFGGSPVAANGSLVTTTKTPSGLVIRWAQRADATYLLQQSADLATWSTSTVVPVTATDQTNLYSTDYVRKEATIPVDSPRKFVRVRGSASN